MIKQINHVAILVEDLDASLSFWRDALGIPVGKTEVNPGENVNIAFLPLGDSEIELLEPISADSALGKFLAKRGQGMHHICVEVDDIDATMQRLAEHGVQMINDAPKSREDGTRYAFVHPKSTSGVLVELYELPKA
ncbi:MAG TPA: methylmalonyl-CoA epimerase [Aggregatilinea sp.]|jgi:methylmalonyl-CoA/ethylmalonyl-CoA epimerase|uniref:methylmalonyl-CoA epimerase n=1 Tax=Aggregatilinea sp. TaxID=2806333 RepID=UPI002C363ADA|nr:methylmalonyl-CoA epimerase [Aggregatilinea sp.]HML23120.1 methylmalonyl-CoA epimerase [Aggregatilinea sp.]